MPWVANLDRSSRLRARVSNVLPEVDPTTRTLKIRLEAENPTFALRPDMFVDVELPVSVSPGLTVPADALLDSGLTKRVFVECGDNYFEPREVETGWRLDDRVQIVKGLREGERVVSAGTFLVDSESRLQMAANRHGPATGRCPVAQ
jgi:Cu(I)/Ag(I) efflux system membrane fusion protein